MNITAIDTNPNDPFYCEECDNDANYNISVNSNEMYLCKSCLTKLKNEIEKEIS